MVFATEFDPTDRARQVRPLPTASVTSTAIRNTRQGISYTQAVVESAAVRHSATRSVAGVALRSAPGVAATHDLKDTLADDWSDEQPGFEPESFDNVVPLNPTHPALNVGSPAVRVRMDENKSLSLPKHPKLPLRLQLLNRLQQGSTVLTTLLVTGALAVYGSTVYVDKSTSRALLQLDALQGESQQLTSANESIKQSLAEQATQADSGLEPYEAGDVLFLTPEPLREAEKPAEPMTEMPGPLGY